MTTSCDYAWSMSKVSIGTYTIKADAIDTVGNVGSTAIVVTKS